MKKPVNFERHLADPQATHEFGVRLGCALKPGAVVGLVGELGAGKTLLAQGIAQGFEVDAVEEVVSPTYAWMFEHPARRGRFVHIDLYRLEVGDSLVGLGVFDAMHDPTALVVIEWADKLVEALPSHAIWILLDDDEDGRVARVCGLDDPRVGAAV